MQVTALQADPWGKDDDLSRSKTKIKHFAGSFELTKCEDNPWLFAITQLPDCDDKECLDQRNCPTPFLGQMSEVLIGFHQRVISPADGPRSNFLPSSSQYTLNAMRKYGFFKGFILGCDRLMRENDEPWVYRVGCDENGKLMKLDPVR